MPSVTSRWRIPEGEALAFTAGGKLVVVGGDAVRAIADDGTAQVIAELGGAHGETVAAHPARELLAVGVRHGGPRVLLVDLARGTSTKLDAHQGDRSPAVAWSADGTHLVTGDDDGTVRLFTAAGKRVASYGFKPYTLLDVASDRDARALFVAPGRSLYRIDVAAGERLALPGEGGRLALSPDGRWLACATYNADADRGAIRIHDAAAGEVTRRLGPPADAAHAQPTALVCVGEASVLAAYDDGVVRRWDVATGACTATLALHGEPVVSVAAAPDGKRAASLSRDGVIALWDLARRAARSTLELPTGAVRALAIADGVLSAVYGADAGFTGEDLVVGSRTTISRWDLASGAARAQVVSARTGVFAAAFDGGTAILTDHEAVELHRDGARVRTLALDAAASLHDTRKRPAAGTEGRVVIAGNPLLVVDAKDARTKIAVKGRAERVVARGRFALTIGYDRGMSLVDLDAAKVIKAWTGVPARADVFAIAPSGQLVLTAEPGVVRVWSPARAAPTATWSLGDARIAAMTFVDDATVLVLTGAAILVYDVAAGAETARHALTPGRWTALAAGEGYVAAGGADGTIWWHPLAASTAPSPRAPAPRALPFTLVPSYEELVAGSLEPVELDEVFAIRIELARAVTAADKQALATLYEAWGKRLAQATYKELGYRTEKAALSAGYPAVRIAPLTFRGKTARGGASRASGIPAATRALVDALAKRKGIAAVTLGAAAREA